MTSSYPLRALFGGTFDPIHWGHIRPLQQLAKTLNLAHIELMPCRVPPHKKVTGTSDQHRLAMLQLVCDSMPLFQVNAIEFDLPPPSYSVQTLSHLAQSSQQQALVFIMGMDSFCSLHRWYQWQSLIDYCHIVVCQRPGFTFSPAPEVESLYQQHKGTAEELAKFRAGKILLLDTPLYPLASSEIRRLLLANGSLESHLPSEVLDYIRRHKLYLTSEND